MPRCHIAAMDDGVERIEPHLIGEDIGVVDVPDGQIRPFADTERAAVAQETERPCGLSRRAGESLFGSEKKEGRRHVEHEQQRRHRGTARIAVG